MKSLCLAALSALVASTGFGDWLADVGGLAGFQRRFSCEVAYEEGAEVTDFPVLVRISPDRVTGFDYSDMAADGRDLVFADANGTVYPREIDTWNPDGESLVWVKIPSAAKGSRFYAYYGNAAVLTSPDDAAYRHEVWSDYAGVWHMGEDFATDADITAKTAYDSTSNGLHAVAKDTSSGQAHIAEMKPYAEGAVGVARVNQSSTSKPGAYLSVPSYDDLKLGSTFTFSGWYYANAIGGSKYPRPVSRKDGGSDGNGWEVQVDNGSTTMASTRGGGSTKATADFPQAFTSGWNLYTWAFNGTSLTIYQNGAIVDTYTVNAPTDNGKPLSFGCDSNGDEQCWNGQYDELRLCRRVYSDDFAAAEYATVTDAAFLSYGAAERTDPTAIIISGGPTLDLPGEGPASISFAVSQGEGSVSLVFADVASGSETTVSVSDAVSGAASFTCAVPDTLPANCLYAVRATAVSTAGTETSSAALTFYNGAVSVTVGTAADEVGFVPGVFTVSVPAAVSQDLVFFYDVAGTAVAGQTYGELPGMVTLPAGETEAAIVVTPLLDAFVQQDSTVILTLRPGAFLTGSSSATLMILDDPSAKTNPRVRYVSKQGRDTNTGLTEDDAFLTVARALQALDESAGGTVYIAPGTYSETNNFQTVSSQNTYSSTKIDTLLVVTNAIRMVGTGEKPTDVVLTKPGKVNNANFYGRILYINHADAKVENLNIKGGKPGLDPYGVNSANDGGNVWMGAGWIDNCEITGGDATYTYGQGGGNVYMADGHISRCKILNGKSKNGGGQKHYGAGVSMAGGLLENCLIAGGSNSEGAGIHARGTSQIINCTIAGNTGSKNAGVYAASSCRVINCAIFGNVSASDTTGHAHVWSGSADGFSYCASDSCATDAPTAINGSCLVAESGGFTDAEAGDYTLAPGSVCVDNGADVSSYDTLSKIDLAGLPRVNGSTIDIGCYEYVHADIGVDFDSLEPAARLPEGIVSFTAKTVDASGTCTFEWDFDGDGIVDLTSSEATVSNRYTEAGSYTVSVKATDAAGSTASASRENYVFIGARRAYVTLENAYAAFPYDTPEKAATNIQHAVDACYNGSEVIVADGVYPRSEAVLVERGIYIHSASGDPSRCMVSNTMGMTYGGTARRNLDINHQDAVVSGFTFAGGRAEMVSGAAVRFGVLGGLVTNCVITGAQVSNYSGDGAVYMAAGHLSHCVIKNCEKTNYDRDSTSAALSFTGGSLVDNCLIMDCGNEESSQLVYANNGVMENCTIVNCKVPAGRYAIYAGSGATVRNCVVANVPCSKTVTPPAPEPVEGEDPVVPEPVTTYYQFGGTTSNFRFCAADSDLPENAVSCVKEEPTEMFTDFGLLDLRPKVTGALLDGGEPATIPVEVDLAGKPRVVGTHGIDIGCFERRGSGFSVSVR